MLDLFSLNAIFFTDYTIFLKKQEIWACGETLNCEFETMSTLPKFSQTPSLAQPLTFKIQPLRLFRPTDEMQKGRELSHW